MNRFETDTHGTLVNAVPLFASNLLALFYVLRKNLDERRSPDKPADRALAAKEE